MRARQKRHRIGALEWGYDMPETPIHIHIIGVLIMGAVMAFSYQALTTGSAATAMMGFAFGVFFLLLIYGHELDRAYIHIGNKIKIGVDSFDPQREANQDDSDE